MLEFLKQYNSRSEKALLALFLIVLCQETIFSYPVAILNRFSGLGNVLLIAAYLVLTLQVLSNKRLLRYIRYGDILLILFFSVYVLISFTLDTRQSKVISSIFMNEIFPCLPFFLMCLCLRIDSVSMDALGKWSCVAVVLTSVYRILYQNPNDWEYRYNMGAAYALLGNVLITIVYSFYTEKKLIPILCSVIGAFYLVAMGTRGPVIVVFSLVLVCIIIYTKIKATWKVIIAIAILLAGAGYSSAGFFDSMGWLNDILSSMDLSTRVLEIGAEGEIITHTSGRDVIYSILLNQVGNIPFFGYGVLGECRFDVLSAHNIYLQSIIDYGYLFGSLFILFIIIISLGAVIKTKGKISQKWILIWMVYVFVRGFVGGGVLRFEVFILIGSCLRILRMNKNEIQ